MRDAVEIDATAAPAIGISGPIGSGKSTLARALVDADPNMSVIKFADPLKAMLRAFYTSLGYGDDAIAERLEGRQKETPCEALRGRSPREAMRTLGTEWGRDLMASDFWTTAWSIRATNAGRVVADDVRFDEEAAAVRALGGVVVEIIRPGFEFDLGHVSEGGGVIPDFWVVNDGPPERMVVQVQAHLWRLGRPRRREMAA